jgi:NAD(P)-dependent dehydrogenase (short-subunit alcohol dehydrogenase family)
MSNFKNSVLITGASTGIGFSCAELFLDNGWQVVAHFFEETSKFSRLVEESNKDAITPLSCDFQDEDSLSGFLSKIEEYEIDALINSAGIYDFSKVDSRRIEGAKNVFMVNTIVPALIIEAVVEGMKNRKNGAIVNISSVGVKYGSAVENLFYGSSKIALESVTRTFAREGAPHNVLVNAIRPGITDTEFYPKIGKDIIERVKLIPLKRAAQPCEISKLAYFLCSENTYITNEIITIAGGE